MVVLRKLKDKLTRAIKKKKTRIKSAKEPARAKTKIKKEQPPLEMPNEVLGVPETAVKETKFSHPETSRATARVFEELPYAYNQDRMVLQVRDPRWIHSYWELTSGTLDHFRGQLGDAFYSARRMLRVYDVSNIIFNGSNAHRFFDIEIGHDASSWYIDTNGPGRSWCVDLGLLLPDGRFITILRSNTVQTPLEGPSWITDEEWMIPDDMFARLYGMGFGFGRSSPVGKAWQERIKQVLFSGALASPGMASMASPVRKMQKERKFWLVLNTELIVYGATEPDAKVTIQGRPLKLKPDGTFSLRFALPDGEQVIPVEATSADELETRVITPVVEKETKYNSTIRQ